MKDRWEQQFDRRAELLEQLSGLNIALARHGAVADITLAEAAGVREIATLEHLVDATARRLALIMDSQS